MKTDIIRNLAQDQETGIGMTDTGRGTHADHHPTKVIIAIARVLPYVEVDATTTILTRILKAIVLCRK